MSFQPDITSKWLDIVYSETPGFINICSTLNWAGRCYPSGDTDIALEYIQELDKAGAEGIYLRATTLRSVPESGRGSDELSFYLPGLWADIDIAGPGHKTSQQLPPDIASAMCIVDESGLPEPSHWVHSGGGLYPWWLLRNPVEISDLEDFRALSGGWQKVLEASAKRLGYHYGSGVGDLSRVLRIPGTVNRKAGIERPCAELEGHSWDGPLYEAAELFEALAAATPDPEPPKQSRLEVKLNRLPGDGSRPGDDFERRVSWHGLLLPLGWQWVYKRGDKWHLRRPGKLQGGASATLSDTTGNLFVFSEECHPLESFKHYSKFAFYTAIEHNGDFASAAKELGRLGYGTPRDVDSDSQLVFASVKTATGQAVAAQTPSQPTAMEPVPVDTWRKSYSRPKLTPQDVLAESFDMHGAGNLYAKAYDGAFRYCGFQKAWHFWDGQLWRRDQNNRFEDASKALLDIMKVAAHEATLAEEPFAKKLATHVSKMANMPSPNIPRWALSDERIATEADAFDSIDKLVTLSNGVYDLESHTLMPHDPSLLMTKQMPVKFDKDATCPGWDKFLSEVLPDVEVREYLQRAIGHALLGKAEQRALFLLHGKSGCGKSQFIRVIEQLFGDFAETATPQTFNGASKTASITNDLNDLKGKRFVTVSELDEGETFNEALVKRLTGGDTAKSRALWQENTKWRVKFGLFMATNHLPRLTSDDDAIWRRVKPVHFPTIVKNTGTEVLDLGNKLFAAEAAGILNWVLDGVRAYQERGLDDLPQITAAVDTYRKDVDVVAQFASQGAEEGYFEVGEGLEIQSTALHNLFTSWCNANGIKGVLSLRRFSIRLERTGFHKKKTSSANFFTGIGPGRRGVMGTMFPLRT